MSFASETKKELTHMDVSDSDAKVELAAFIRMNGAISFSSQLVIMDVQTENAAIARRMYQLLKDLYEVPIELLVRRKMKLKKNNVYIVRLKSGTRGILEDLRILEPPMTFTKSIDRGFVKKRSAKRAYLRGAFLASGSVNNPETSSYHLEIFSVYEEHNEAICALMNQFDLNARTLERKNGFITYLKEAEKITEFLSIIGATSALLHFEDVRIMRDMRNSVNRLVNCETANLNKTINAAVRQIDNIKYIQSTVGLEALPERLREIAALRIANEDVTLKELGEMLTTGQVSKSGINHRLRKLDQIAERLRSGETPAQVGLKISNI
ncbi:DNA-binding protein WhiA [Listeria monocytogenes]|uniref:DNA-binding protein WhiA n=1 Tax=Listeria monocytogenes TaxID=1639 RepID=UPI00077ABD06|nr:DNA-binding protein WhiA [Listeria monocytogenes]EAD3235783.1 DNA-binding protein WhiA [Listeria monocytogenes CFSAN002202]EAG9424298.1 DNA-binding protein WhiA [Listeria monocytogenes CFSAN002184]EAG9459046.1 DNA-binding protein WhiA [Listeria monocytogenes CFSAN002208]ECT1641685.1 DNA-binding protein WhiA [Listeria monocytogenes CFSAN002191]EHC5288315.1 DNA-binding protein WhiA [Listeria monocytogenes serotype 1/2a]